MATGLPPTERTALLRQESDAAVQGHNVATEEDPVWRLWLREFWFLTKAAVPVVLAYSLQNSLQTASVLVVGRLSPEALAVSAFSYMFTMSTAWLVALGGTTALDTLCSSTFTGSKNPHDLGVLLQRAFVVLGLLYIPISILWYFSEPIFILLDQEPELAKDAARFLRVLIPGGLGYIYFESLKKFLQAQGTYVLCITSPLNVALNYLFVYTFDFGLLGAPAATGISYWLSFLLLLAYARFVAGWDYWGGWSRKCLEHMSLFTKLALAGIVHVGTEWWAFEIITLMAGRLGTIPLAAQSVIASSDQLINTIPFGIGVAASARVGNLLGARDTKGAARAANAAAWLSICFGTLLLVILMSVRDSFAKIFNDDIRVIELTAKIMPYVALFQIADGLNGSCGGSLRGMGRQHVGAGVNIVSYYAFGLPIGIALAFHGWGLSGLWLGNCLALYAVGAIEWAIVWLCDWDKQVRRAFERMDEGERIEAGAG